jgi:hypothetical protein
LDVEVQQKRGTIVRRVLSTINAQGCAFIVDKSVYHGLMRSHGDWFIRHAGVFEALSLSMNHVQVIARVLIRYAACSALYPARRPGAG